MTFSPDQIKALSADLDRKRVAQRAQAGRNLSYIEAWWAIAEANRIFGFDAWNRETVELRQLGEPRLVGDKYRVGYMARVRITVEADGGAPGTTITREGSGFGSGIDKDVDQAHESALKEAESDAMKRALMTFGNPFGLALYDKTQAHVSDAPRGVNPSPPGPDFPGAEGSPGRSSYAAKKDGGSERFIQLQDEIASLESTGAIASFIAERKDEIGTLPEGWRKLLREALDEQKHAIAAQADA